MSKEGIKILEMLRQNMTKKRLGTTGLNSQDQTNNNDILDMAFNAIDMGD